MVVLLKLARHLELECFGLLQAVLAGVFFERLILFCCEGCHLARVDVPEAGDLELLVPHLMTEHDGVLCLVLICVQVIKHSLLISDCERRNIGAICKVSVVGKNAHHLMVALVLRRIHLLILPDDSVANSHAGLIGRRVVPGEERVEIEVEVPLGELHVSDHTLTYVSKRGRAVTRVALL